jgi:hypothetical protein
MKLRYATPDLEREQEANTFGQLVIADLQELLYENANESIEALVAREPAGDDRKYILTLGGLHPKVKVQTFFLPADVRNKRKVKYRVSKAYAELLRALVKQPI